MMLLPRWWEGFEKVQRLVEFNAPPVTILSISCLSARLLHHIFKRASGIC
jgi:hypothetical protein